MKGINMDTNAKPTGMAYLFAVIGATAGIALGTYLRPKIEDKIRQRRQAKSLDHAFKNPTYVTPAPGSPLDTFLKERGME